LNPQKLSFRKLAEHGIKALSTGPPPHPVVLHLDVHPDQVEHVVKVLGEVHG